MAFRGGPPRRYHDPPLIKLVEEYLVQNKHRSFINLDDMGAVIRTRSFKYSRMKQSVFKEQLKRAYATYSTTAVNAKEDFAGDKIEFDDTPLDDKMLKEMEGYPSSSDEDSDSPQVEDIPDIAKDVGVNQMKSLYMAPSSSSHFNSSSDKEKQESSLGNVNKDLVASIALASKTRPVTSGFCVIDSVSVSSNSDISTKSDQPPTNATGTSKTSPEKKKGNDEDSESDLEIIDEVQHDRQVSLTGAVTVSTRAPGTSTPSANFTVVAVSNQTRPTLTGQVTQTPRAHISNSASSAPCLPFQHKQAKLQDLTTNKGSSTTTNGPVSNAPGKGVKRKPSSKSGDEPETGINEDFTRKRPRKEVTVIRETGYKLKDFAGSEKVVEEVCKLVMHLKHSEIYQTLGVTPPRGFLLHGPPGTGKTLLANAIAGELEMPLLKVAGTELVSGISGESESNIRELFNQAVSIAPCIIFIDEIDSVTPRRENANKDMERRIVAQLLACIDDLVSKEKGNQVLLIGATNRIESIDTALRRAGRFDREICLGIPDEKSREKILSVICRDVKLNPDVTTKGLAKLTPGYVGADLQALVREAAVQAVNRKLFTEKVGSGNSSESNEEKMETDQSTTVENSNSAHAKEVIPDENQNGELPSSLKWIRETASLTPEELNDLFVCMKDYEIALKTVQPSSKREGFATVPDITWDDIGALHEIRDELQVSILGPVKHAEAFKRLGLNTPAGVLLCGPPGCGKTLLAKAVANEAGINFISVKGPELLNMYVGESERAVRQCFLRARNSSPCVIFFDELDALCPRRSEIADNGSGGRIVNQLLTEMDGIESRQGVFVMAATNRPDIIDPAVLRPGRLDKILFVNLPTPKDRFDILKALTKNSAKPSLSEDVNMEEIANSPECEDYTGADLAALVREASIAAFRELVLHPTEGPCSINDLKVSSRHFKTAFRKTKPSVGKEDRLKYKLMAEKYSSIR